MTIFKVMKRIKGNLSKTKESKNLVLYPNTTLEHWQYLEQAALDEISAVAEIVATQTLSWHEHWHSGILHLDFSSSFFKGTGIFRTERIIIFQGLAALQPVQAASSNLLLQRLLHLGNCSSSHGSPSLTPDCPSNQFYPKHQSSTQ